MGIDLFDLLTTYGYLGALVASFLGGLLVFVPGPYLIPVALLSLVLNPWLVALYSAVGSVAAKFLIFRASYLGRRLVGTQTHKRMRPLERLVSRYGGVAAFIAAVTPIPDDIVYIPLGVAKFNAGKFLAITFAGKFIITSAVAWGSRFSLPFVTLLLEGWNDPVIVVSAALGLVALVGGIVYVMFRADWASLLSRWFPWTAEGNGDSQKNSSNVSGVKPSDE